MFHQLTITGLSLLAQLFLKYSSTVYCFSLKVLYSHLQFGFKNNSSCSHAIFLLKEVTDYFVSHGSNIYMASLDARIAFERVNHVKLFNILINKGLPGRLMKITRMRGKAQPDGRPALQIIETPFLYFSPYWTKVHVQRRFSVNILLQWEDIRHRPI